MRYQVEAVLTDEKGRASKAVSKEITGLYDAVFVYLAAKSKMKGLEESGIHGDIIIRRLEVSRERQLPI